MILVGFLFFYVAAVFAGTALLISCFALGAMVQAIATERRRELDFPRARRLVK